MRTARVLDNEDAGWIRDPHPRDGDFEQENGKTRVRIVQRGLSSPERRDTFEVGWGRILDRLSHKAKGDRNGQ
jgi:Activator of Hsp90 ATPase homolog 1-like protein